MYRGLKIGLSPGTKREFVTFHWGDGPQPPVPPFLPFLACRYQVAVFLSASFVHSDDMFY